MATRKAPKPGRSKATPPARIPWSELLRRLADPDTPEEELRPYFKLDPEGDAPFSPRITPDPKRVEIDPADITARGGWFISQFNRFSRAGREQRFQRRLEDGYAGPIVVAEGDSWFQYPIFLNDVIDYLSRDYAVLCLSAAGDTLSNMVRQDEYLKAIVQNRADFFLISGGGNDLVGDGQLKRWLVDYDPDRSAAEHLVPEFDDLVRALMVQYNDIFRRVREALPGTRVLCHCYDDPIPTDGKWLGEPMRKRGIVNPVLQRGIASEIIQRFATALRQLVTMHPNVALVETRGAAGGQWFDELHPKESGYKAVAERFGQAIAAASAPPRARAHAGVAKKAAGGKATGQSTGPVGYSLHIGLNEVDPDFYSGWKGELVACENDAAAMRRIAGELGYQRSNVLLTAQATRKRVVAAIESAARAMKSGDIFLLTYSGHGGQSPDGADGDEADGIDETWCLYDDMLIDDELYVLWTQFPKDARIVLVSDSCHSGSVARMLPPGIDTVTMRDHSQPAAPRIKSIPLHVAAAVWRRNQAAFTAREKKAGVVEKEQNIASTVRLLSGCQDDQFSYDGLLNGAFTDKLLRVWGAAGYRKPYGSFYKAIRQQMPMNQVPAHSVFGRKNLAFDAQSPFEI